MQNYFALSAPQVTNAQVDFSPIGNALEDYRTRQRQAQQDALAAQERQYQRGRNAQQDQYAAEERKRSTVDRIGKQALAIDQSITDPVQRQAALERLLSLHPDRTNLPDAYRNPTTAFKLIAGDAGLFLDPNKQKKEALDLEAAQTEIEKNRIGIAKTRQEMENYNEKNAIIKNLVPNRQMPGTGQPPTQDAKALSDQPTAAINTQNAPKSLSERIAALPEEKQIAIKGALLKDDYDTFYKILDSENTMPGGFKDPKQVADVEEGFRKEYSQVSKPYFEVRDAYNRIRSSAKNPSAAGDLALIFNYMKILDPGSTVREGEFANAQNAAGVPDQVRNQFNKLLTGERLGDTQRTDFINTAERLAKSQEKQYSKIQKQYESIAKRKGLDTRNIILDYSAPEDEPDPTQNISGNTTIVPGSVVDYLSTGSNPDNSLAQMSDEELLSKFRQGR